MCWQSTRVRHPVISIAPVQEKRDSLKMPQVSAPIFLQCVGSRSNFRPIFYSSTTKLAFRIGLQLIVFWALPVIPVLSAEKRKPIVAATTTEPVNSAKAENSARKTLLKSSRETSIVIVKDPITVKLLSPLPPGGTYVYLEPGFPIPPSRRWELVLGNIEFRKLPRTTYAVYLNLPGADVTTIGSEPHFVGTFSFYQGAHRRSGEGEPRTENFDVTEALEKLKQMERWDQRDITITIVPFPASQTGEPVKPAVASKVKIRDISLDIVTPVR